jgi:flagellar basal-body rod protein FlgC
MSLFKTLDIAASGMSVQRTRMNVAATNIANQNTTRTEEGGPYRRRDVVVRAVEIDADFSASLSRSMPRTESGLGVEVEGVVASDEDPMLVYDPGHPDADETGHVAMPNVSRIKEMVNMMGAARAYEAGTTVVKTTKDMAEIALRIGR